MVADKLRGNGEAVQRQAMGFEALGVAFQCGAPRLLLSAIGMNSSAEHEHPSASSRIHIINLSHIGLRKLESILSRSKTRCVML